MTRKKVHTNSTLTLIVIFVVIGFVFFFLKRGNQTPVYPKRQLPPLEILETIDLQSQAPSFQLHIQTPPVLGHTMPGHSIDETAKDSFTQNPQKLLLKDKQTGKIRLELPLTFSAYQDDCLAHHDLHGKVKKWDTEWFTLSELPQVDSEYNSKLADKYDVEVLYGEGESQEVYASNHEIAGVCYQVSQSTAISPMQEELDDKE